MSTTVANISIESALRDPQLLGACLGDPDTWHTWLAVLGAAFGLKLNREERRAFAAVAGSRKPPREKVNELWVIAGRGGGKSRMSAAIAVYIACFTEHDLDPGETGFVLCLAGSRDQSSLVFNYCLAFLRRSPVLRQMIKSTTMHEIRLNNGVTIAVHSNSYRLVRGKALLAVIADEIGHWRSDEVSANPDIETYRAVRPSLVRCHGMWIAISTPYRRAGLLYTKHRDFYETDDDDVLVTLGTTSQFNPTIDPAEINKELLKDPEGARSEWLAEFRSDRASLLDDAVIADCIDFSRPLELPPRGNRQYHCFVDASAGRHDAFSCCIGHLEGDVKGEETFVADVIRGRLAPFSDPRAIAQEYTKLAREYGCSKITGDHFAAEWVASAFRDAGMRYETSPLRKSDLYLEMLPHFNRAAVEIPNFEPLLRELRGLERRVHRSGKDSVDHGDRGTDDFANCLAGAVYMSVHEARKPKVWVGTYCPSGSSAKVSYAAKNNPHLQAEPTRYRYVRTDENGVELTPPKYVYLESKK
jgi:hypothetical protein